MKKVLTIAGSDCSGGAGIQADIKTMTVHGVYAMSAVTALTAQNTTGVAAILESTPEFLEKQLDMIFTDIFPDAVKIGMVGSAVLIRVIAERLNYYRPQNIVLDPVMVATSGSRLIREDAVEALMSRLMPMADLITPNLPEAEALSGVKISGAEDMLAAAREIAAHYKGAILIKGGHLAETADDLLYREGQPHWFSAPHVNNPNAHGTGCTLSSAIASNLALGYDMNEAIGRAKRYITGALQAGLDLGQGRGPLNHLFQIFPQTEPGMVE